jgi:F-type H+-transporting ATPase subunit b
MSIDFFTLCAQIINLLILLFLLKKFLYLPILKVLEDRKKLLENEYKVAEIARKKAEVLEKNAQEKYSEIEHEKQKILAQSHEKADALEQKLLAVAEQEFSKARQQWKNKLISEQNNFDLALQNLIAEYFQKFATGALDQMADISLNELFLNKLMQKISAQKQDKKSEFVRDFLVSGELELVSAENLDAKTKQHFKDFIQKEFMLTENPKIKFSTDKNLICGVVLKNKEQMIEWNLAEYISEFSNNLNTAVSSLINKE